MKKNNLDREITGMLASPLLKHIIAELNPDMAKLRKAIWTALVETGFDSGTEYLDQSEKIIQIIEKAVKTGRLKIPKHALST